MRFWRIIKSKFNEIIGNTRAELKMGKIPILMITNMSLTVSVILFHPVSVKRKTKL